MPVSVPRRPKKALPTAIGWGVPRELTRLTADGWKVGEQRRIFCRRMCSFVVVRRRCYTRICIFCGVLKPIKVVAMNVSVSVGSRRGSPEIWLDAAYETLLESGVDAVKIQPLAAKLNLSRTSFYWFFGDREQLLEALVSRWREKNTGNILKQTAAYAETIAEAILNVFDCWLDKELFDAQFEFAVRSWALQSPEILEEVQKADSVRVEAMTQMFRRFGFDATAADVRAQTVYLVQIGYISKQTREGISDRMARIPSYIEIFSGQIPERRELDRFFSRHQYSR